jgi:hypothetical protein
MGNTVSVQKPEWKKYSLDDLYRVAGFYLITNRSKMKKKVLFNAIKKQGVTSLQIRKLVEIGLGKKIPV